MILIRGLNVVYMRFDARFNKQTDYIITGTPRYYCLDTIQGAMSCAQQGRIYHIIPYHKDIYIVTS